MTQKQRVKNKLRQDGYVDNFWCLENKLTLRLASVINVLRNEGMVFDDAKSGYVGETKNWRYYLKEKPVTHRYVMDEARGVMIQYSE